MCEGLAARLVHTRERTREKKEREGEEREKDRERKRSEKTRERERERGREWKRKNVCERDRWVTCSFSRASSSCGVAQVLVVQVGLSCGGTVLVGLVAVVIVIMVVLAVAV